MSNFARNGYNQPYLSMDGYNVPLQTDFLSSPGMRRAHQFLPPVLFLIVCVLAYGLQAPWQGYYLDDWIILNAWNLGGAERVFEYAYEGVRPLVFWLWWLGFKVAGSTPFYWQVWALLWRWLAVVFIWLVFRQLWPQARWQTTAAALLFAVYPVFRQQSSALTYSFHWICFFLYGLSLYWMILSTRNTGKSFYGLMFAALVADFFQIFSQEFFVGLALLRPLVLWLALRPRIPDWRPRLGRTLFYWAPYLIVFAGWVVWRMVLMPVIDTERNTPELLYGLMNDPLVTLIAWVEMFFQDMVQMIAASWHAVYEPGLFMTRPLANLAAWGVAAIAFVVLLVYFQSFRSIDATSAGQDEAPWYRTAVPFGLAAVILGFLPGWIIGRHIYDLSGVYNDRFGLASMPGAALLVVALVDYFFRKPIHRLVITCLLVALAVGYQFREATDYRWSWERQLQFYWQLKWRVPHLQAPAAILGDGALIPYMGSWATISALVQMYEPHKDVHYMDYWYWDLQKMGDLGNYGPGGDNFVDKRNFMRYDAPSANSLVVSFEPENNECLWVLSERDRTNRFLTQELQDALFLSNPDLILAEVARPLREDIFGAELPHEWCYYYQSADLARQVGDWERVIALWREAEAAGDHPRVGIEYGPFIEGFARTGDWETAVELTQRAYFPDFIMRDYLCETWSGIAAATAGQPGREKALHEVIDRFECQDELNE